MNAINGKGGSRVQEMACVTTGFADQTLPGFGDTGRLIDDVVGDYGDTKEQVIRL